MKEWSKLVWRQELECQIESWRIGEMENFNLPSPPKLLQPGICYLTMIIFALRRSPLPHSWGQQKTSSYCAHMWVRFTLSKQKERHVGMPKQDIAVKVFHFILPPHNEKSSSSLLANIVLSQPKLFSLVIYHPTHFLHKCRLRIQNLVKIYCGKDVYFIFHEFIL